MVIPAVQVCPLLVWPPLCGLACYLTCPRGGSCCTASKWASCRSSEPPRSSSTTWTPLCRPQTWWVSVPQQVSAGTFVRFFDGLCGGGRVRSRSVGGALQLPQSALQPAAALPKPSLTAGPANTQVTREPHTPNDALWTQVERGVCVATGGVTIRPWNTPFRGAETSSDSPESRTNWSICRRITASSSIRPPASRES